MRQPVVHRKNDIEVGRRAEELAGGIERIHQLALSRRGLLKGAIAAAGGLALGAAGLLGGIRRAMADEPVKTGKFVFPRLKFSVSDETGDIWNTGLIGDAILRQKLKELTNINASDEAKTVRLGDFDDLCQNPFVFMTSEGHFKLPDNEQKNLREFLERGGFIHADDCVFPSAKGKNIPSDIKDNVITRRKPGDPNDIDRFFRDYCCMINDLFPDNPMRKVPDDHEIYNVYFEFKNGCPHMQGVKHGMWGLFEPGTGRVMTVATPGDLHCGWMSQYFGKDQDLKAIQMGINIIIYFLSH
ncbi:MAG: DUF4159 domain-containing protein [Phycisphaerae bacterium]